MKRLGLLLLCALPLAACGRDEHTGIAPPPPPPSATQPEPDVEPDQPIPDDADIIRREASWPDEAAFDPLYIQNIDVVDPARKEHIENLRALWEPGGALFGECTRILKLAEAEKVTEYQSGLKRLNEEYFKNTHLQAVEISRDAEGLGVLTLEGETRARLSLRFPVDE